MNTSVTHRSALYVPGDHSRAMEKAATRGADILIFDLEDGVAPEKKASARDAIAHWLQSHAYLRESRPLKIVRINHRKTGDYREDLAALACAPYDGLMLSKTGSADDVDDAAAHLARYDRADTPIWCNIETPLGIERAFEIAAHACTKGIVAGTNDLANDLHITRTPDRAGLMHSLQRLVLAARAYGRIVLDGTVTDLNDEAGLRSESAQGKMLGFDGKTLIHPKQIAIANEVFGISQEDKKRAHAIITAYEQAMREGKAVTLLGSEMIEKLHYERAQAMLTNA